jgi:plasmid stabilization system protein ParE
MSFRVIIRKRAEEHIQEAFSWYEQQKKGLSDDFLMCFESALHIIEINPLLFQRKYRNIRSAMISRFPYGIFYFTEKQVIIVIAVFHLSRNPRLWGR